MRILIKKLEENSVNLSFKKIHNHMEVVGLQRNKINLKVLFSRQNQTLK